MTHVKRGIFSTTQTGISDLQAALEFVKNSALNSNDSFDVTIKKNSHHLLTVEINSQSAIRNLEKSTPKTRIRVPAGLYDLSW